MHNTKKTVRILAGTLLLWGASLPVTATEMTFFVTSAGPGNGANLGGLEGADRHCQTLAAAAGAGKRTWRAYLSTQAAALNDTNVVHARDRIGTGPWFNAKGALIARNVDELHSPHSNLTKATLVDEKGQMVNGRTEKPNRHDILTGSRPDGTAFPPSPPFNDMTCGNWTKGGDEGMAMTGHHDRAGPTGDAWATSWNSAHPSRGGCSQKALQSTGGDGLFYCFAEK
ncbi:hypothetical protein [Aromatoleum evansii]|uniref:Lectin n=1 Tax=Aromatoleum evansii TaxID=59406 RepID=A0ABZ1AHI7_AROEV|nr:hypothetical protein [Aromatoleum evansii]NMG28557.1 hypothetical protein [Aromatoleum evansii]WRL45329.1 hypothetical protein U5817_19290 [Aromatoleum evansii]